MGVIILFAIFLLIWVFSSIAFDNVIAYQHERYPEAWERDGKPRGMFFHPKGGSVLSFWAMGFLLRNEIPDWAANDETAVALFRNLFFWKKIVLLHSIAFIPLVIILSSL